MKSYFQGNLFQYSLIITGVFIDQLLQKVLKYQFVEIIDFNCVILIYVL